MKITDGRVIADFFRDALGGRDLVLFSDGSPTRTFCYVSDAITGYYLALLRGRRGEAYNVGVDGPEISMLDLAEMVAGLANDLFGHDRKVVRGRSPETDYLVDNPNRRCPDITKARQELQYRPRVTLEEGLRRTLLWYSGNQAGEER
jgi:UDP-glucuronate decarboxylase